MSNVFSYFFQAGLGLAVGISVIAIPAFKIMTGQKLIGRRSR